MPEAANPPELRRPFMQENTVNQLAKTEPAEAQSLTGGMLSVIERAARDPSMDIDKLERLFALQERLLDRQAKLDFIEAKRAMRPFLPVITERGKIIIRDKNDRSKIIQETSFALFEDMNEILMPVITEHGFDITFRNGRSPEGKVCVYTVLSHVGGHSEETFFELPPDGSGSKNAVQAIGSSTSYAKRYGMLEILNITTKGEDNDGETATVYRGSGDEREPVSRAKLAGPHTSKTALRKAVLDIIAKVNAAANGKEISQILRDNAETREQAERDWPALINGDPKIPEDVGLRGAVERQRAALSDSGMVGTMLASMKECQTLGSFYDWLERNETAIAELDGAEVRRFERERDAYEESLKTEARVRAG